jgi:ribosomal protein S18 acetylase RimI-like enzyme
VDPRFHGKGVGKALGERVIADARGAGYRAMRLDTSIRQAEAIGLYRRLGFRDIDAYYHIPAEMQGWLVFMQLDL